MSLNILQRSIVNGALALSALTSCSAVSREVNPSRAEAIEDVNSPKNIERQRKNLRKRIVIALENLFSNYDKLNKMQYQVAQEMEYEKDKEIKAYNKRRVERCSMQSGGEETVACREQMYEIIRPIQDALVGCSSLERDYKIKCSTDVVITTGKGEEYLKAIECLSSSAAQNLTCLELTAPRKTR